jgi:hypothetical protein
MFEEGARFAKIRSLRLVWLLVALGCQKVDHPPPPGIDGNARPEPSTSVDGGVILPKPDGEPSIPAPDGSIACGGQRIPAVVDRPNLYFVIDVSGSMAEPIVRNGFTKYTAARRAVGAVLRAVGHRVRYGTMIFPASADESSCEGGEEIFPLTQGDPRADREPGSNGPTLQLLLNRLASRVPEGATPTAAALAAARASLRDEPGRSHVVLATDGAPNCGEFVSCPSERCMPDIERVSTDKGEVCGVDLNCCGLGVVGGVSVRTLCIDDDATVAEVAALSEASVPTYVIGMPGSEAYGSVLERLAETGGTARRSGSAYYAVTDEDQLTDALLEISAGLTIGCEIELESAPQDPALVNLYFDSALVPQDPADGWDWSAEARVILRGRACDTLKSGDVSDVQLVYGCRTVVR